MAEIIRKFWRGYTLIFDELADPRTKRLLFLGNPFPVALVLGLYLMFVLKWGPKWMKNRPPFNLSKLLMLYNAVQVLACSYIFVNAIRVCWGWDYKWICEPVDYSENYKSMQVLHLVYVYFLLKVIDLMDTVFFVLRKKFNQITFLHVYHHTGMVMLVWGCATYYPGGHGTLVGVINSFVHVVMYSYYFLTVSFPSIKQSSWWKKYITQLQILQFFLNIIHMSTIVFKSDCEFPRWTAALFLPQDIFMLLLFIDFYIKAYVTKPKAIVRPRVINDGYSKLNIIEINKDNAENEILEYAMRNRKNLDTHIKGVIIKEVY